MVQPANQLRARLGASIRTLRLLRGWSQEALGETAGLSYKFIGEVERGVANPTVDTLQALATALHVGVADLFGRSPGQPDMSEYGLTREQAETAREALSSLEGLVRRLSPKKSGQAAKEFSYRRRRRRKR